MLEALNCLAFHVASERQEEAGDVGGFVFGGVRNASYGGSLVVVAQGLKPPRVTGGGSEIFAEDRAGSGAHNESHCGFEGMERKGRSDAVLLRGKVVAQQGKFVGETGSGIYLPR